jgi:Tfp pilus assembly protein PilF
MLGHLALRRKDLPQTMREFERALDLQPYNAELLVILADLYVAQGNVAQARDRLEDAVRFAPQNQGARQRLGALQDR